MVEVAIDRYGWRLGTDIRHGCIKSDIYIYIIMLIKKYDYNHFPDIIKIS